MLAHDVCYIRSDDPLNTNRILLKSNHGDPSNANHLNSALDQLNDLDSEEAALHEFDFLTGDAATATTGLSINELNSTGMRNCSSNQILSVLISFST